MTNDLITRTLAALDPAGDARLDDTARRRADARREQIMANDPHLIPRRVAAPRRRRWVAAGLTTTATVAVAGGVIIGSTGPSDAAYASWTATPSAVGTAERGLAGDACLESVGHPDGDVVLTERRGDWIAVAAVTQEPGNVSCLVYLPAGSTDPSHVLSASAGGQGALPGDDEFTEGSLSEFRGWTVPGAPESPTASFTIGDVGAAVAAVDIVLPDGDVVRTTVDDGRFIAWWPGRVFEVDAESGEADVIDLRYRITLRDGTVVEDAQPMRPE